MPRGYTNGPATITPGSFSMERCKRGASRQSSATSMWDRRDWKSWKVCKANPPPFPRCATMNRTRIWKPSFEAQGGSLQDSDRCDDGNRFTTPSCDLTLGIHDFLLPLPRKIRSALRGIFSRPVLDRSDSLPTLEKHLRSARRPGSLILNSNTVAPAYRDTGLGPARYGLKYASRVQTPGTLACGYSWSAPGTSPSATPETRTSGSTSSEAWNGSAMRSRSSPSWRNMGPPAIPRITAFLRFRCT